MVDHDKLSVMWRSLLTGIVTAALIGFGYWALHPTLDDPYVEPAPAAQIALND